MPRAGIEPASQVTNINLRQLQFELQDVSGSLEIS